MKKRLFLTMLLLVMGASQGFAWTLASLDHTLPEVATDQENINTSGRVSEGALIAPNPVVVNMDGEISETPVKAVGIEAVYTDNVSTYNLPLSYGFPVSFTGNKELLNFRLVIPYTRRELGDASDSGLGDVSLTTNYLLRFPKLLLDSKLIIKAPTGEVEDADVPLGTGSTDAGLFVNGTWFMDKLFLKAGLGYSYNGNYTQNGDEIKYGDEYLVSAGLDYKFMDNLKAGGVFLYKSRSEDDLYIFGGQRYVAGVSTLDFIPSVSYLYQKYNVELIATATIPVTESWNTDKGTDPINDPDRSASFSVSASKPF